MRGPDFLRTKYFPFVPKTDFADDIKLGVVTKEQDDDSTSSASSATRPCEELSSSIILFDKFNSY